MTLAGGRSKLSPDALCLIGLAAVFVLAAIVIWSKSRGWIFHLDEWSFVLNRRDNDADAFLAPHNDHLSVAPVLIYKALLGMFGMTHYGLFMATIIALNLACGGLLFVFARRRVGNLPALALAAVIVMLGPAWEDLLWPFQMGFLGSIAAGLGMLLALEADSRRGDLVAGVLLGVAIAFSGTGVPLLAAAAVYIAVSPGDRVRRLVRVVAIPLVLYAIWYLAYQDDVAAYREAIGHKLFAIQTFEDAPRFAFRMAGGALSALVGLEPGYGPALVVALMVALIARLAGPAALPPRTWAVLALVVTYFGLTALGRVWTQGPDTSRYIYPAAVMLALLVAELAAGRRARGRTAVAIALLAVLAVLGNLGDLRRADRFEEHTEFLAPKLTMIELARDRVDADLQPDAARAPDVRAGTYLDAVDDYGSPADSLAEVARRSEPARQGADVTATVALGLEATPATPAAERAPAPPVEGTENGTATGRDGCHAFVPATGREGAITLPLPEAGLAIEPRGAPVAVRTRRFADGYPGDDVARVEEPSRLVIPRDDAGRPWHVRLASTAPFTVCGVGPG